MDTTPPGAPRLFLVDGYALIYRAFFALIARPLTTSRGENTSAAWGIANFVQRLIGTHKPEYLGWVHDSGLSFRHERYPAYKATREKLTDELQADFDRGMERICALLDAFRIPILALAGYEQTIQAAFRDVADALARRGTIDEQLRADAAQVEAALARLAPWYAELGLEPPPAPNDFALDFEGQFAALIRAAPPIASFTFAPLRREQVDALHGAGTLVDADMNEESTKLQALQVKQQLGIQALSIANSGSQSILSLFR